MVQHQRNGQLPQRSRRFANVADGLVHFIVARFAARRPRWRRVLHQPGLWWLGQHVRVFRWLVGQRTRHTTLQHPGGHLLRGLFAAQYRIRRVHFAGALDTGEVYIRRHLRVHAPGPQNGLQNIDDPLAVALLQLLCHLELFLAVAEIIRVALRRQQPALLVNHGDGLRLQVGHTGGHQVHDARQLPVRQYLATVQVQHDRGGRLLPLAQEGALFGHGQVHAGTAHTIQSADGARQLLLQGTVITRLLHKAADTDLLLLIDFVEADVARAREALGRQQEPRTVHLVGGHGNHAGAIVEPVVDAVGIQRCHRRCGVFGGHAAEQGLVLGHQHPLHQANAQRNAGRQAHQ